MIANDLSEELNLEISKRQIDSQPLRLLGLHKLKVRLTIDLIPEVSIVVYREGEPPENYMIAAEELAAQAEVLVAAEIEEQVEDQAAAEIEEQVEDQTAPEAEVKSEVHAAESEAENDN
jgi:large subunit ribosomal protein L9